MAKTEGHVAGAEHKIEGFAEDLGKMLVTPAPRPRAG